MKKRVLVLNCGTTASTDINMMLRNNDEYEIWGASTHKNHGIYVYKNYIEDIPNMNDENFISVLNQKIDEYDFKFIIPQHDDLVLFMQENKESIRATIISSPLETAILCRYKSKLYSKIEEFDYCPKVYSTEGIQEYPVFAKIDNDQGGRNAFLIQNKEELDFYNNRFKNLVICEYLPGIEVTVDCLTDKNGKLKVCIPRYADRMLAGIDVHSSTVEDQEEIRNIAESLKKNISFKGYWFFQVKKSKEGKYKVLEISSRFAGGIAYAKAFDLNLPLMSIREFDEDAVNIANYNSDIMCNADKQFWTRYILTDKNGKRLDFKKFVIDKACFEIQVNPMLMMLVYQEKNKGNTIIITYENEEDKEKVLSYLKNNNISPDLFDIVHSGIENSSDDETVYISRNDLAKHKSEIKYHYTLNNIDVLLDWKG